MKTLFIRRYKITFSTHNMLVYDAKYAAISCIDILYTSAMHE